LNHAIGVELTRGVGLYSAHLAFTYLALEGPIGVGKTALASGWRRGSTRRRCSRKPTPFLADFYNGRPGRLQAQLFYLLNRHRQQQALQQGDLFRQATICDYLFDGTRSSPT